ncbi:MAG TPA: T3SS effector HopA1 family protein [Pyrinomonadaceae bacterium]|jgi:hypothetical protein|nr:T3SS effector HopA1 family protein [Pyrinomonadaceae bacterium]
MSHERAQAHGLQQELDQILGLVCIHSADSFSYPQAPAPTLPPPALDAAERLRLVLMLRDTLYARCYARAPGEGDGEGAEDSMSAEEFARRLSAANRGREGWLEGWRVESVGAGGAVLIARGSERRVATAGDYALTFAEEVPPCVGCAVTLRLRKESSVLQEGVYYALGAEPPQPHEEGSVVRLYFNAPPTASLLLTEAATTHLNEWSVPFTLKVMLRPEDRDRRDAAVLYLPRQRHDRIFRLLEKLPPRFFPRLRAGVPLFTKPLREGVGLAESPSGGESFGMHRCRLLAESIVEAWAGGRQDAEARRRALEQRFAAEGLSLARAYLNPGGEDVYEPAPPDSPSPQTRDAESFGVLTRENVKRYLDARGLCASPDGAAWRVAEHHSRNRNFAVTAPAGARSFFVKQLRAQDPESFAMLRREARVYELARETADFAPLVEVTPPFFGFDPAARTTVLGALEGESLMRLQRRLGRFTPELASQLGRALATVHRRVGRAAVADPPPGLAALGPPGIFTAHRGGPLVRWLGAGQMRLVEQVREDPRLARVLDELAATWRRDTFMHGDIKFENCVAVEGRREIRLVDWELADFGEAAWDVGSSLQAHLALRVSDAPVMTEDGMRGAVAAFWRAYGREAVPGAAARGALLERSLLCAAARLIQSALEVMHGEQRPTPLALSLVAAAVEVVTDPREAARRVCLRDS